MSFFQLLMLAAAGFFAFQIYRHVQTLEEPQKTSEPILDVESIVLEADAAYERGALDLASEKLESALKIDSENTDVLNKLGYVQAKQGRNDEAIESYIFSLKIDNTNDMVHNAIASIYRSRGEFQSAQEHYDSALAIDDAYALTYYNYGNLLCDMGKDSEAKDMYEKALQIDPDYIEAREALQKLETAHG